MPLPLGVSAETLRPFPSLDVVDWRLFATREARSEQALCTRASQLSFGVTGDVGAIGDIDPNNLAQAGWGVIFPSDVDPAPLKDALKPLLDLRKRQAGENLYKVFEGFDGIRPNESARAWIERHGASLNVVDPEMGVPFYLVLIGDPVRIRFEFQYTLDIFWAVGRLDFPTIDEYRRYAESVVEYERATTLSRGKHIAMFATCHDFDLATQMFMNQVAKPLAAGTGKSGPLGKRQNFVIDQYFGRAATKANLEAIFRGRARPNVGAPAILFSGSHGMGFRFDDKRLISKQGALICQDWPGYGRLTEEHWFAAADIPSDASVHGLIHFLFACFGAGTPRI